MKKYYIDQSTAVDARFAIELGDNNESGDQRLSIYLAPMAHGAGHDIPQIYLVGNGDPVILCGWSGGDDFFWADDEIASHFLDDFGIDCAEGEAEREAEDFLSGLLCEKKLLEKFEK